MIGNLELFCLHYNKIKLITSNPLRGKWKLDNIPIRENTHVGAVPQSLISLENAVCVELSPYIFGIQRNVGDLAPCIIFTAKKYEILNSKIIGGLMKSFYKILLFCS